MQYAMPGNEGALYSFQDRYANYIGGDWVAPLEGKYFDNITPVTGAAFCEIPRSTAADLHKALNVAHDAADGWGKTSAAERSNILLRVADRIEQNLEVLAYVET
jgi:aldehyde dehydrogenase